MNDDGFDAVIHAPHRLRICVMLAEGASVEFATLREHLEVADSVLSKQLKLLVDAGYVHLSKPTGTGGKVRTWASLTRAGRKALNGHLQALDAMMVAARAVTSEEPVEATTEARGG